MRLVPHFGISSGAVLLAALGLMVPGIAFAKTACSATTQTCTLSPSAAAPVVHPDHIVPRAPIPHFQLPEKYHRAARTIARIGNGQATILKAFTTPLGLYGFSIQLGHIATRNVLVYVTPDGKYFMFGGIFTADGKNLSRIYSQKYLPAAANAPKVKAASPSSLHASIEKTTWFTVGKPSAPRKIWLLLDPNCIFCHLTYEKFLPYVQKGDLSLKVVLVGFLKPSSAPKAAAILMASNPARALALNESRFNEQAEEGGIVPPKSIPPDLLAEVRANTAWQQRSGIAGTPYLLWKGPHGHYRMQDGMPLSITSFIKGIGR